MTIKEAAAVIGERIKSSTLKLDGIKDEQRVEYIRETIDAMQALVDNVCTDNSWIRTSEQPPPSGGEYITWYSSAFGEGAVMQNYNETSGAWSMVVGFGGEASHWRPLPDAPEDTLGKII